MSSVTKEVAAKPAVEANSAHGRAGMLDPTTFAVVYNALNAIVKEMSLTFEYSAWSSIIAEARDFSCAVYDAGIPPNALCVLDGLPIHVNAQPVAIGEIAKFFGPEELNDGDVILLNSAYYGNTHVGDFVIAMPIFYEGEHLFWSAATGHHMDIGSSYRTSVPTYATDIWSEGLQISPLKIADRGVIRKDVVNFLLENVRYRDFVYGDLMSQIGSAKTGCKRLLELLDTWGPETLRLFSNEIIDYADRRTRDEIASWPDGVYESEAWVDSDGYGRTDIAIRCKLTIDGHRVSADFAGSDPQGRGGVNAGWATCRNSVSTAILMCIDPTIPHNEGCLQHIDVKAPKGTIVNAEWPAPTAAATIVPADAITDAVWKCLAQAIPDKAVAGCGHVTPNCVTTGIDRRAEVEKPFGVILFNGSSGGGASSVADGWPFMVTPGTVGGLRFAPIEIIELHFPLMVREYQVRTDSMGAGEFCGGPGLNFRLTPRGTGQIDNYGYGDGMSNPPFGLFGGKPGDGGALYREDGDGSKYVVSAFSYFRVHEGQTWCAVSTGGGGYGNPLERPTAKVAADTRDDFVSVDAARSEYGVVFHADTFDVDETATVNLRGEMRAEQSIVPIDPPGPNAATYFRSLLGPNDEYVLNPRPPEDADSTL
ncbi:MAG: hydantoinase B/oxoprolinase family protein [Pseudomonadota bacterium]